MRKIEFRGLDIETNEWVYGGIDSKGDCISISIGRERYIVIRKETLGQYTGLKDKNGEKIFEGDILLYNEQVKTTVSYKNGAFIRSYENSNIYLLYDSFIMDGCLGDYEVIGNIYENPELLEGFNMNENFIKFIEEYSGVKLTTHQKLYLKALLSKEDIVINARNHYKKLINNLMIEYRKKMKMDFDLVTPEGIEQYRNGELVNVERFNR